MEDVIYDRQEGLGITPPQCVSIIGCGGIGAWVAIDLAIAGADKLLLFDDDHLEMHNLNRVPFAPADVGKDKTIVLQDFITRIRPATKIIRYGKLTEITENLLDGVVVDCTDRLKTQALIQKACKRKSLPYYRVGCDGHHITVIDGQSKKASLAKDVWEDGSGHEGYTVVEAWVVPPQICAAIVSHIICMGVIYSPISIDVDTIMSIDDFVRQIDRREKENESLRRQLLDTNSKKRKRKQ